MNRVCTGIVMAFVALVFISSLTADIVSAEETPVVVRGEMMPITSRLLQNGTFGDPVVNQYLLFYDQTLDYFIGSALTDIDGYATVSWNISINHPLGLTLLNVTFEGNNTLFLAPSCQWLTVLVISRTSMEVQVDKHTVNPEDEIVLTSRIADDNNVSIANALISVYSDDILLTSALSNASGYATLIISCNASWCTIGQNTLKVVFEQDLGRYFNGTDSEIILSIHQILTSLEIQGSYDSEVALNDSFLLQMRIQAEGEDHPNATLIAFLDEIPVGAIVSDEAGLAILNLSIDSGYALGIHTMKIEYAGSFRYAFSHLEFELTITSPATILVEFHESIRLAVETEVQVTLHDFFLRPIPNAAVTLFDEATQESYLIPFSPGHSVTTSKITFMGPLGPRSLHITVSEIPFLTNTTGTVSVIVWSDLNLFMIHQNILGYASPSQEAIFQIQLNSSGNQMPNRQIEWRIESHLNVISATDDNGIAEKSFELPSLEGSYLLVISYNGSIMEYELPTSLEYEIIVSKIIPVIVNLVSYSVSTALQEISVQLSVIALNGTPLENVELQYEWLSHRNHVNSKEFGMVEFGLPIPVASGIYNLYYEMEETPSTYSSIGYHAIFISETEAMAAQGVGIPVIVLSIGASISIATIPILWRRRLVG